MGKNKAAREELLPDTLDMLILKSQLGDVESSFTRLIEAITLVMRPA